MNYKGIKKTIDSALISAKDLHLCKSGDKVIVISAANEEHPDDGDTLNIKIVP